MSDSPLLTVWNKSDACSDPHSVSELAGQRGNTCFTSAATGEGMGELVASLEARLADMLEPVHCLVPYNQVRGRTCLAGSGRKHGVSQGTLRAHHNFIQRSDILACERIWQHNPPQCGQNSWVSHASCYTGICAQQAMLHRLQL